MTAGSSTTQGCGCGASGARAGSATDTRSCASADPAPRSGCGCPDAPAVDARYPRGPAGIAGNLDPRRARRRWATTWARALKGPEGYAALAAQLKAPTFTLAGHEAGPDGEPQPRLERKGERRTMGAEELTDGERRRITATVLPTAERQRRTQSDAVARRSARIGDKSNDPPPRENRGANDPADTYDTGVPADDDGQTNGDPADQTNATEGEQPCDPHLDAGCDDTDTVVVTEGIPALELPCDPRLEPGCDKRDLTDWVSFNPDYAICIRYRWWSRESRTTTGLELLASGYALEGDGRVHVTEPRPEEPTSDYLNVDPCVWDEVGGYRWEAVDFQVCLSTRFTYAKAVAYLSGSEVLGDDFEDLLWNVAGVRGPATFETEFGGNLASHSREPLWSDWDSTAYEAKAHASPRRAVMLRAMSLICDFEEGLPSSIDGEDLRAAVADPIKHRDMEFRIYSPNKTVPLIDLSDTLHVEEWAVVEFVRPAICYGASRITLVDDPMFDLTESMDDPDYRRYCDCLEAGTPIGHQTTRFEMDLTGTANFKFFCEDDGHGGKEFSDGANHGAITDRVWFCQANVDRHAIVYDYYVDLATRHFAMANLVDDDELRARYLAGCSICLRCALAVAVDLACMIIHETSHNLNLWHCRDRLGVLSPRAGCQQDFASMAWWTYVTARVGLPNTGFEGTKDDDSNITMSVRWALNYGLNGVEGSGAAGEATLPGTRRFWKDQVECWQGTLADPSTLRWLAAGGALLDAAGLWEVLSGNVAFGALLIRIGTGLLALELELDIGARVSANLEFAIDTPLMGGGRVLNCCVRGRPSDCRNERSLDPSPCWQTDPPNGAGGCCDEKVYYDQGAMDRYYNQLGRWLGEYASDEFSEGGRD